MLKAVKLTSSNKSDLTKENAGSYLDLVFSGQKVHAIKALSHFSGISIKDARVLTDALMQYKPVTSFVSVAKAVALTDARAARKPAKKRTRVPEYPFSK